MPRVSNAAPVSEQLNRLKQIDRLSGQRMLTKAEIEEMCRLLNLRRLRRHRLPEQLNRARQKVEKLESFAKMEGLPL